MMLNATFELNCVRKMLDLHKPVVMGIINVSPESFCPTGRLSEKHAVLSHAMQLVKEGAAILDIGAQATNPQTSLAISLQQELDRLLPIVEMLHQEIDIPLSVDTSAPEVMRAAVDAGASMINDVRALQQEGALATAASLCVPVCLMHMANYSAFHSLSVPQMIENIKTFLLSRRDACLAAGVLPENIMVDPGFGSGHFGKSTRQNLAMIKHLQEFTALNAPLLIGASRKFAIGEVLHSDVNDRLFGSVAIATLAVWQGASIIRVHDVKPTVDAITIAMAIQQS